jgi:hypothetical protein
MAVAAERVTSGELRARRMVEAAYGGPKGLSRRFRLKRFARVTALIDSVVEKKGRCRIADIGGTRYYWDIIGDYVAAQPIEITLINREAPHPSSGKFVHTVGDATDLAELPDMSFDLAHANSVIEHVGDWAKVRAMAATVRRLAPAYYVQTPCFWFPFEPHFRAPFIHWLPEQLRYRLVRRFALGFADAKASVDAAMVRVQSARLLDRGQFAALFPDAEIFAERFCGLTKSLIAVRA